MVFNDRYCHDTHSTNEGGLRRRIAKAAVVALAVGAFGAAGLTGSLAQSDDDLVVVGGGGGIFADNEFLSDIFGDDFLSDIFDADVFGVDVPSGGSGGNLNVGGSTGGGITIGGGGGGSGGITLGGGSAGGSGGGSGGGLVYE